MTEWPVLGQRDSDRRTLSGDRRTLGGDRRTLSGDSHTSSLLTTLPTQFDQSSPPFLAVASGIHLQVNFSEY